LQPPCKAVTGLVTPDEDMRNNFHRLPHRSKSPVAREKDFCDRRAMDVGHLAKAPEVIAKLSEMNVRRAYSRLMALKNNLPGSVTVDEKYVQQFDSILDTLEKESGQNLDAFRVSGAELRHRMTSKNTLTGEVGYSESPECHRPFLMMKIDACVD
jgi:hypothetical protein